MIEKLDYVTDDSSKRKNNILKTVAYGVFPHIGCIGFIIDQSSVYPYLCDFLDHFDE